MSLYVYVVPVTNKQADAWEKYVEHRQSLSIFSSHSCWESNCYVEGIDIYKDSISLGRPMCNSYAAEAEKWYGKHVIGENDFTIGLDRLVKKGLGTPEGVYLLDTDDPNQEKLTWVRWLMTHQGQTVIVCNDNEI